MLINITKEAVKVMYNQQTIKVVPGGSLDVREFGLSNSEIPGCEKHLCFKKPGIFKIEETKDILKTNKEHVNKISGLEKEVSELKEELSKVREAVKAAEKKQAEALNNVEGFKTKNDSLVKQVGLLKAKVKKLQ